jgi:pimeloyl-ACP methyl ester carboxylesterase
MRYNVFNKEDDLVKKKIIISVFVILLLILLLPYLKRDMETEVLSDEVRAELGGDFIKLSDGYTHYELKGSEEGKTIILVHGNAAPSITWDNNIDALVDEGYRVLRYDIFGHGYSDRPKLEKYNRDLYDRQLLELIDKLEITTPVSLVGTSQGGSICAYFAASHPTEVEKIAFLAPLFDSFNNAKMASLLQSKCIGEYIMKATGDKSLTNPKVLYSTDVKQELTEKLKKQMKFKGKKRAVLANMRGDAIKNATPYYEKVKELNIPVLLTWGENDKSISKESMERLRELIPNINYYELENASHLAQYEFSNEINKILINFMKNN